MVLIFGSHHRVFDDGAVLVLVLAPRSRPRLLPLCEASHGQVTAHRERVIKLKDAAGQTVLRNTTEQLEYTQAVANSVEGSKIASGSFVKKRRRRNQRGEGG